MQVMGVQWWEVIGLVGVTLVISAGRIFEPLRDWLMGFEKEYNPLRILGMLLGCSMCCGVWVGFLWGVLGERLPWSSALILGGLISITALVADELIGIVSLYRVLGAKKSQGAMTMDEMVAAKQKMVQIKQQRQAEQMSQARARRRGTPRDITENEADTLLDAQEAAADAIVLGEPPKVA